MYLHVDLIADGNKANKVTLNPYYKSTHIINENLVAIISRPSEIKLNKPYAVGKRVRISFKILLVMSKLTLFLCNFRFYNLGIK